MKFRRFIWMALAGKASTDHMRSSVCRGTCRRLSSVHLDECFPLFRYVVYVEVRFGRAFGNVSSAVNAFIGSDIDHRLVFIETFDWAYRQARLVFAPNAGLSNDHR